MGATTILKGEVVSWPQQDTGLSIEEAVEAEPIAEILHGHVDGPTHERPTAMERPCERIKPLAGNRFGDRLTAQFKFLLPIDNEGLGAAPGLAGVASPAAKRRPER